MWMEGAVWVGESGVVVVLEDAAAVVGTANEFLTLEKSDETSANDESSFSSSAKGFPNVVSWLTSSFMLTTCRPRVLVPPGLELLEDTTLAVSNALMSAESFGGVGHL